MTSHKGLGRVLMTENYDAFGDDVTSGTGLVGGNGNYCCRLRLRLNGGGVMTSHQGAKWERKLW